MANQLAIVACSKQKLGTRARAVDLYSPSRLFSFSIQQALADGCPVLILSSKYGLVSPDTELDPYEVDLLALSDSARRGWETMVERQLDSYLAASATREVVFFAGTAYREPLQRLLRSRGVPSRPHGLWASICDKAFA
jgi:hypothetical protein